MIRTFLPVTFLFSSVAIAASNPTPVWPKDFNTEFKNKTFNQAFCEKPVGFQTQALCEHLKKNKNSLSEKLISMSVQGTVLTLQDGKRSVEIKRLKNPMQFEVNHKVLDLTQLREPTDLLVALNKALPKVAARSLWINSAYALEIDSDTPGHAGEMVRQAAVVLNFTVDNGLCERAKSFFLACEGNVDGTGEKSLYDIGVKNYDANQIENSKDDSLHFITSNADELVYRLHQMQPMVENLNNSEVRSRLRMCPAFTKGNKGRGDAEIDICAKTLAKRKAEIRAKGLEVEKFKQVLKYYEEHGYLPGEGPAKATTSPKQESVR